MISFVNTIHHGSCLEILQKLSTASVDSIVTDVPYGLGNRDPSLDDIFAYLQGSQSLGPLKKGPKYCLSNILKGSENLEGPIIQLSPEYLPIRWECHIRDQITAGVRVEKIASLVPNDGYSGCSGVCTCFSEISPSMFSIIFRLTLIHI